MPSAIGGLTPEYRGADIRGGLNERLGCGPNGLSLRLLQRQQCATNRKSECMDDEPIFRNSAAQLSTGGRSN